LANLHTSNPRYDLSRPTEATCFQPRPNGNPHKFVRLPMLGSFQAAHSGIISVLTTISSNWLADADCE
jgi:hypothetical protein